jgi:acetoin utilization deacetylase AcuC-like enzyme
MIGVHSSNGFCFFNNIAIGAAYAKFKYRSKIKKIAIVDFDVHHGNGTEEIIRNLSKHTYKVTSTNKICETTFQTTLCKPWLDEEDPQNVLFVSIHGFDEEQPGNFYPSSGKYSDNTSKESPIYPGGILNIPINGPMKLSHGYRNIFRMKVTPRLMKFQPDIIFISAGFDGHENEEINASYMKLTEHDYRWMTEEICRVANIYSEGRVISVLEGGYNINTGVVSSFAQSVMTHTKFLNICANKNIEQVTTCKVKRKKEFLTDFENYKRAKKHKTGVEGSSESTRKLRERKNGCKDVIETSNTNIDIFNSRSELESDFIKLPSNDLEIEVKEFIVEHTTNNDNTNINVDPDNLGEVYIDFDIEDEQQ